MGENIFNLRQKAEKAKLSNQRIFKLLKKRPPQDLDEAVHDIHIKVFKTTDCLECANCCRTLGPRISNMDIDRLSKYLKLKPSKLIEKYLFLDEDGDYVFRNMPCPFLMADNKCSIYEQRPRACREYPHTDRKKFYQLLDITLKNTYICPAVYEIVEEVKRGYGKKW